MAYYIPGTQTGPFGGPQGSTLQAMMQLMSGYMAGQKKLEEKNQMKLLAEIFKGQGLTGEGQEPITRENVIEKILQNPSLKPQTRMLGIKAASTLPVPAAGNYKILEYWDKDGVKHKKRVLDSNYNQKVAEIEAQGGSFEGPEKAEKPGYTIIDYYDKSGKKRKKRVLESNYNKRVAEIEAQGGTFEKDEDKELSEPKARKILYDIAKYRQKLQTTGGMDELLFAIIARENPELAKELSGKDLSEINKTLDEYENWAKGFVKAPANDPFNIRGGIR